MAPDRRVIQEIEYPLTMSWELAERWAEEIPTYSENDPRHPEWAATPIIPLDLTPDSYGVVYVKDESVNPTGTHKDRPAWEVAAAYRDYARILLSQKAALDGAIETRAVPRFTLLTAGNAGRALAAMLKRYQLPPPKLLVNGTFDSGKRARGNDGLDYADIYHAALEGQALTPADIKTLTNNEGGIELTSVVALEPQAIFYDWLVHEAFNQNPAEIYAPYGSGRLHENFVTWQQRNARLCASTGMADPRLQIPLEQLAGISILGAEPVEPDSDADKLAAKYKPFILYSQHDHRALQTLGCTGPDTGIFKVGEDYIREAQWLMQQHGVRSEASGAAGLALYMQRFEERKVDARKKVLVINTGRGI